MPSTSGSVVIALKPEVIYRFYTSSMIGIIDDRKLESAKVGWLLVVKCSYQLS
jgi:hypothetical protein